MAGRNSKATTTRKRAEPGSKPQHKRLKSAATSTASTTNTTTTNTKARNGISEASAFQNQVPSTRLDVYVFGDGSAGELGLGPHKAIGVARPRLNPLLDASRVGVVDVAAGGMHAATLTHDGLVLTWGVNDNHALGRDTTWNGGFRNFKVDDDKSGNETDSEASDDGDLNPYESTPTAVPAESFEEDAGRIVSVTAGDSATFVLTERGLVYGWGTFVSNDAKKGFHWNEERLIEKQARPMLIPGLDKIVQISAGNNFCLALNSDGKVYSWGMSEQNQLGRRTIVDRRLSRSHGSQAKLHELHLYVGLRPSLVSFPTRTRIISVHAGSDHAFAVDRKGDTWAWGLNNFGQTGIKAGAGANGSTIPTPQKVKSLMGRDMRMLQGGTHHSVGVTHRGECLVWGRMDGAQMGIDLTSSPLLDDPQQVVEERGKPRILLEPTALSIPDCSFVAAGSDHNILITSEGKAYSWGFNVNFQCGQGSNDDIDEIDTPTLIDNTAVRGKKLTWAGAGGQYSMLAGPSSEVNSSRLNAEPTRSASNSPGT